MATKLSGFSDEQSRALAAELARVKKELLEAPFRGHVLDRRGSATPIRPQPSDYVRVQAGDVVVLPNPRPCSGRTLTVIVEEQPVEVLAESSTVNDVARLTVTALGAMAFFSTGQEWWGTAVGGSGGGGGGSSSLDPIPDQRVLGNDAGVDGLPVPTTVHQVLDWLPGAGTRWVFDGVDDRADFGNINSFEFNQAFSLGAWTAVTPAVGAFHDMFVKFDGSRGFSFYVSNANKIGLFMTTGGVNTLQVETTAAIDGAPHQVVATHDGSGTAAGVRIYVDSVSVALTTVDSPITATMVNAANFAVGGRDIGGASMFAGVLFETAAWSAALTPTQVLETYAGGVPPDLNALATAPDPVFWAKFDDLDAVGANGIINYGTGAQPGTAEGGLEPTESGIGGIPVRATNTWGLLNPGAAGLPLVSNGTTAIPSYQQLALTGLPTMAANTYLGNATGSAATPTAVAVSGLAGAGMTATGSVLNCIGSTSITVNANDIQRPALTGFAAASANSNATTSAEPIVTYSASANMSAERVTTASTSITVNTGVASQIAFERAALTGDVTAAANSNTTAIAPGVIVDADVNASAAIALSKLANIGANQAVGTTTGGTVPTAISAGGDTAMANLGEGPTQTGYGAQTRDNMARWLDSQTNVRVFEEEFQGRIEHHTGNDSRFAVVSGLAGVALSTLANSTGEYTGALDLASGAGNGTTRGTYTLGANENAFNFHWNSLRYFGAVFRTKTLTTANTHWALGLVGPFDTYGAVTAPVLAGTSEGIFIEGVTNLSANFRVGRRTGSATAVTDTGVAVADNRFQYEFFRTAAGVDYHYLNGSLIRTDASGIAPTGTACTFFFSMIGSTTTNRSLELDHIKVVLQSTNRFT
jgi:hypothetical protein